MQNSAKILLIGANGQLGTELLDSLSAKFGKQQVIACDIRPPAKPTGHTFEVLNVLDLERLEHLITHHQITQIYHLAAILSAKGESNPLQAWDLNMHGLLNVLESARKHRIEKIFWPSSIAVFGKNTPADSTPQATITEPQTMYGISKRSGELLCQYYFQQYGVDVRSLRYPGLIGYKALPGGGTTDFAVEIFHKAIDGKTFHCFLHSDTRLPMMYMDDAVKAAIDLMDAPSEELSIRTSYNIQGISFTPEELAEELRKHCPELSVTYEPDYRQGIADSWPRSLEDSPAKADWHWHPDFDLEALTKTMWENLKRLKSVTA